MKTFNPYLHPQITLLLILSILITSNTCLKLPVHCIKSQVVGTWKVVFENPRPKKRLTSNGVCGYYLPPSTGITQANSIYEDFQGVITNIMTLDSDNKVHHGKMDQRKGKWTMIGDSAVEIQYHDRSLFAFFLIKKLPGKKKGSEGYQTHCNKALVGIYHTEGGKVGCFTMKQTKAGTKISKISTGHHIEGVRTREGDEFSAKGTDRIVPAPATKLLAQVEEKIISKTSLTSHKKRHKSFFSGHIVPVLAENSKMGVLKRHIFPKKHHRKIFKQFMKNRKSTKKFKNIISVLAQNMLLHKSSHHILKKNLRSSPRSAKFTRSAITLKSPSDVKKTKALNLKTKTKTVKKKSNDRGRSFGVNNYLGYIPFFAQTGLKKLGAIKKTKALGMKNGKGFYIDIDKKTMDSLGKKPEFTLDAKNINGKMHLVGVVFSGKQKGKTFILTAQTAQKVLKPEEYSQYIKILAQNELKSSQEHGRVKAQDYAKILNSSNLGWKAEVYPSLSNKMISMAKEGSVISQALLKHSLATMEDKTYTIDRSQQEEQQSGEILPKEYNLRDYLSPSINQGKCKGSDAISAIQMMEARVRLTQHVGHEFKLNAQKMLECNYYSQGCENGNAYASLRFMKEYEVLPQNCGKKGITFKLGNCEKLTCDEKKLKKRIRIDEYGYIGGHYGASTEIKMMKEIFKNGPIIVTFNPTVDLHFYKTGIFQPHLAVFWQGYGVPFKQEWWKGNEYGLLYGWGTSKQGIKFWRIQTSYGPNWGENGSFRLIRGMNALGVERTAMWGTPIIEKLDSIFKEKQFNQAYQLFQPPFLYLCDSPEILQL